MKVKALDEIPRSVLDNLREMPGWIWQDIFPSIQQMSPTKIVVYEDEVPLLAVGAYRQSLLTPEAEVWLLPTKALGIQHLGELRRLYRAFVKNLPVKLVARTKIESSRDEKFIKFFGGRFVAAEGPIKLFEVN